MSTLTLTSGDPDDQFSQHDAVLGLARELCDRCPDARYVISIIVDNYVDCLRSLVLDLGGSEEADQ